MFESSGRVSPEVYRRRRIVVGVLALVVLALIIWLVSWAVTALGALFGNDEEPEIASTPIVSEQPKEPAACNPKDIKLTASTAAESFALSADEAILEMGIENTSGEECSFNVGTSQQEFLVTSGDDRIFSSKDCQVDGEDLQLTLKPKKKEQARFGWGLQRSAPKCVEVASAPQQGTYKLTVKLGKLSSEPVTFYLR